MNPDVASDSTNLIERIRGVLPSGWEVNQGVSRINVSRKSEIPSCDIEVVESIPCWYGFGKGSEDYAMTNGISVDFTIEQIGSCSDTEYFLRKSKNAEIWAQLIPLGKKVAQIPEGE